MSSDRGRALLLASLTVAGGCGGVHDISVPHVPILVLHGHVDVASLDRADPAAPLLGALVWAAVPTINPVCVPLPSPPDIQRECPDPYGVFYGQTELAAPVDADGNFDLVIFDLPKVAVSVGGQNTRIAYGALVVVEDSDGNGQPSFPTAGRRGRNRGGQRMPPMVGGVDAIVAATFHTLRAPQQRIAFREGGFVAASNFYPACGWTPADLSNIPPDGFSVLNVPAYSEPLPPPQNCAIAPVDARIEVPAISRDEGVAAVCRPIQQVEYLVRQPQNDEQPAGQDRCLGPQLLASIFTAGLCPSLFSYALKGCGQDPGCATPEWNLTAAPPPWWPCH